MAMRRFKMNCSAFEVTTCCVRALIFFVFCALASDDVGLLSAARKSPHTRSVFYVRSSAVVLQPCAVLVRRWLYLTEPPLRRWSYRLPALHCIAFNRQSTVTPARKIVSL